MLTFDIIFGILLLVVVGAENLFLLLFFLVEDLLRPRVGSETDGEKGVFSRV